ncbi:MAG: helical backbone metal receptor [Gemmatimonadales bacterium]|nr:helical backbone metal receptor [Gemmatimonadales bacterium]
MAVALGACRGAGPPPPAALTGIDDAGDTVRLARPAARVVSLVPATTELLFALGAGPRLVGRSRWCTAPAAAAAVPSLGDGIAPSLEAILAATPDLVILYRSTKNAQVRARLVAAGIATVQVTTDRLADVPRVARLLGALTGRATAGDSVAAAFDGALASLRPAGPAAHAPVRLFILQWPTPPMVAGAGSHLTELVALAGGENVFADLSQPSAVVGIEAVAERAPELVLSFSGREPEWVARPEWRAVRAVRERRIVRVPDPAFDWPGPRALAAVPRLRAALDSAVVAGP